MKDRWSLRNVCPWTAPGFACLLLIASPACASAQAESMATTNAPTADDLDSFFRGGHMNLKLRSYYMDRDFKTFHIQESMAAGGWVDYESGWWHHLGLGFTPYTSQGMIFTSPQRDGAGLLAPGQESYTVLGQAYLKGRVSQTQAKVYRQSLDTPFINPYDTKMTPVTVEAYTLESRDIAALDLLGSHVTGIKPVNGTTFLSMTEAAGITNGSRDVTLAGARFNPCDAVNLQVWNYYAYDFMNLVYAQYDGRWKATDLVSLTASLQALDQRSVGQALGGEFHTGMAGLMGGVECAGIALTLGGTLTDRDHDIVNPWGGYPGYTSIMENDCDLAGEKAWVLGLGYDFAGLGLKGLSAFMNHTEAWRPDQGSLTDPAQYETNLTTDYRFSGCLKNLCLRVRLAVVENSMEAVNMDFNDFRVILNYDLSLL